MNKIIDTVAQEMNLPSWWVKAIAVQYLECRDFADRDEIWTFNFNRISKNTLKAAVHQYHVIAHQAIFHNVHPEVLSSRLIEKLVSNLPVPLVKDGNDCIAEGPLSNNCVSIEFNPIDVWDPKLNFASHFQVFDNGQFWQWRIARFEQVQGRSYGKWVSDEINLDSFEEVQSKLAVLRNPIIKPEQDGHAEYKLKVEAFYMWLDGIWQPILHDLEQIHRDKLVSKKFISKVTTDSPPLLSRFETFTVQDEHIQTCFSATPIFYRATFQHANKAEDLASKNIGAALVSKLDEIFQERASAIILGTACLESFINSIGFEHYPKIWIHMEQMRMEDKYKVFLELKGKGELYKNSQPPFQFLQKLKKSRNSLIHFKGGFHVTVKLGNNIVTHSENDMPRQLVRDLPQHINQLIKALCQEVSIPPPTWLDPQPSVGWLA
jgi:hypothetical protein